MNDPGRVKQVGRIVALAMSNLEMAGESSMGKRPLFDNRGISDRVIEALIKSGIDAPERLLFMDQATLAKIPGVGPKGRAELENYRSRFLDSRVSSLHPDNHPKPTGPATDAVDAMDAAITRDRKSRGRP